MISNSPAHSVQTRAWKWSVNPYYNDQWLRNATINHHCGEATSPPPPADEGAVGAANINNGKQWFSGRCVASSYYQSGNDYYTIAPFIIPCSLYYKLRGMYSVQRNQNPSFRLLHASLQFHCLKCCLYLTPRSPKAMTVVVGPSVHDVHV